MPLLGYPTDGYDPSVGDYPPIDGCGLSMGGQTPATHAMPTRIPYGRPRPFRRGPPSHRRLRPVYGGANTGSPDTLIPDTILQTAVACLWRLYHGRGKGYGVLLEYPTGGGNRSGGHRLHCTAMHDNALHDANFSSRRIWWRARSPNGRRT